MPAGPRETYGAQTIDTVLNAMEGVVSGTSAAVFATLIAIVNVPLAFLIPSSSGHAALAMPIHAPLAEFADVSRRTRRRAPR